MRHQRRLTLAKVHRIQVIRRKESSTPRTGQHGQRKRDKIGGTQSPGEKEKRKAKEGPGGGGNMRERPQPRRGVGESWGRVRGAGKALDGGNAEGWMAGGQSLSS